MRVKERFKIAIQRAHALKHKPIRLRVHPDTREQYMADIRDRVPVSSGTVDPELERKHNPLEMQQYCNVNVMSDCRLDPGTVVVDSSGSLRVVMMADVDFEHIAAWKKYSGDDSSDPCELAAHEEGFAAGVVYGESHTIATMQLLRERLLEVGGALTDIAEGFARNAFAPPQSEIPTEPPPRDADPTTREIVELVAQAAALARKLHVGTGSKAQAHPVKVAGEILSALAVDLLECDAGGVDFPYSVISDALLVQRKGRE